MNLGYVPHAMVLQTLNQYMFCGFNKKCLWRTVTYPRLLICPHVLINPPLFKGVKLKHYSHCVYFEVSLQKYQIICVNFCGCRLTFLEGSSEITMGLNFRLAASILLLCSSSSSSRRAEQTWKQLTFHMYLFVALKTVTHYLMFNLLTDTV